MMSDVAVTRVGVGSCVWSKLLGSSTGTAVNTRPEGAETHTRYVQNVNFGGVGRALLKPSCRPSFGCTYP